MSDCPNPTLVPMTPALVRMLAWRRIDWLKQKRAEYRDKSIVALLAHKKWVTEGKWYARKQRPLTLAEATEVFTGWETDKWVTRFGGDGFSDWRLPEYKDAMRAQRIRETEIPGMKRLVAAADLVANDCEMWVDIATAKLLADHQEKQA